MTFKSTLIVYFFGLFMMIACGQRSSTNPNDVGSTKIFNKDDIKGNWYLNKWKMYHTLSFDDSTVFVDNHIDSVFTMNYSILNDSLVLKHNFLQAAYTNKIIRLTKDTLVVKGFGNEDDILRYSRTKTEWKN